jgi:hypothetical protein
VVSDLERDPTDMEVVKKRSLLKNPPTKLNSKGEEMGVCSEMKVYLSRGKQTQLPKKDESIAKRKPKRRQKGPLLDKGGDPIRAF